MWLNENPTWSITSSCRNVTLRNYGLLRIQVQEVVGVMRNNIDKVLERDSKLNDLDYRQTNLEFRFRIQKIFPRASNLQATSAVFQQSSRRLRKKYWWQ